MGPRPKLEPSWISFFFSLLSFFVFCSKTPSAVRSHGCQRRLDSRAGPSLRLHGHGELCLRHHRHPILRPEEIIQKCGLGRLRYGCGLGMSDSTLWAGTGRDGKEKETERKRGREIEQDHECTDA